MKNKSLIIGLVIVVIVGGIIAATASKNNNKRLAAEQAEKQTMMKQKEEASMIAKKDEAMMEDKNSMMDDERIMNNEDNSMKEDTMMKELASTYLDYSPEVLANAEMAQKSGRKVVLFFHANWCPFCRAADTDFKANINTEKFPKNVTLIKTDYDSQVELKKKYGVNYQHTFVQIDSSGNQLTKWVSGET